MGPVAPLGMKQSSAQRLDRVNSDIQKHAQRIRRAAIVKPSRQVALNTRRPIVSPVLKAACDLALARANKSDSSRAQRVSLIPRPVWGPGLARVRPALGAPILLRSCPKKASKVVVGDGYRALWVRQSHLDKNRALNPVIHLRSCLKTPKAVDTLERQSAKRVHFGPPKDDGFTIALVKFVDPSPRVMPASWWLAESCAPSVKGERMVYWDSSDQQHYQCRLDGEFHPPTRSSFGPEVEDGVWGAERVGVRGGLHCLECNEVALMAARVYALRMEFEDAQTPVFCLRHSDVDPMDFDDEDDSFF